MHPRRPSVWWEFWLSEWGGWTHLSAVGNDAERRVGFRWSKNIYWRTVRPPRAALLSWERNKKLGFCMREWLERQGRSSYLQNVWFNVRSSNGAWSCGCTSCQQVRVHFSIVFVEMDWRWRLCNTIVYLHWLVVSQDSFLSNSTPTNNNSWITQRLISQLKNHKAKHLYT